MEKPPGDRRYAVRLFPGDFGAALQFIDAHLGRLKDDMLPVVQLPIAGKNATFGLEPFIQPRVWERRNNSESRKIDFRFDCEARGFEKYISIVAVQTKHEASLKRDAALSMSKHQLVRKTR